MDRSGADTKMVSKGCHPLLRLLVYHRVPWYVLSPSRRDIVRGGPQRFTPRTILVAALLLAILSAAPLFAEEGGGATQPDPPRDRIPTESELVAQGAVIGDIRIRPENIFDIEDPRENNWLFRLANRLHARTRPWVIARQLLFQTGDRYDPRLLAESERILRSNRYLYDARIRPVAFRDGRVDIEVRTRDVWTLQPGFSFGRKGGENTTSLDLRETNLLGFGSEVGIASSSTPDRDTESFHFADDHLFGTWLRTEILFENNSDGGRQTFLLERPFYALDTRWAAGAFLDDVDRIDALVGVETLPAGIAPRRNSPVLRGMDPGLRERRVWRFLGATRDESRFSELPEGRGAPGPGGSCARVSLWGIAMTEDDFEEAKTATRSSGPRISSWARAFRNLGYATPQFGSDRYAVPFSATLGKGGHFRDRWTLLFDGTQTEESRTRSAGHGPGGPGARLSADFPQPAVFASLSGAAFSTGRRPPAAAGGRERAARIPPAIPGRRPAVSLHGGTEILYEWYPFRLFRIGGAIFFDMGVRGEEMVSLPDSGLLKDAGFGLRIGIPIRSRQRHSRGLAFPFDGDPSIERVQFLVETKKSF